MQPEPTTEQTPASASHAIWPFRSGTAGRQAADRRGDGVGVFRDGSTLYLARLACSPGAVPVISAARVVSCPAFPNGAPAAQTEQLGAALSAFLGDRRKASIWSCLDSPEAVIQSVRVPQVRPGNLPTVVYWTLRKERPLPPVEDTVLDFEELRTIQDAAGSQVEVNAVAVPRVEVTAAVGGFAAAGMDLAGLTPPIFAHRNLLRFAWPDAYQRQCIVISVEEDSTDVYLFAGGKPLAARSARTGINSLRQAFAQTFDVDAADARVEACMAAIRGGPLPPEQAGREAAASADDVLGWIRPAARRLVRTIQRTLHAYETELGAGDEAQFFITGRVMAYPVLCRFLGTQLGVALAPLSAPEGGVVRVVPEDGVALGPEQSAGLATAVGLALSAGYNTANLLYPFRVRHRERQRVALVGAVRLLSFAALAAVLCAFAVLRFQVLIREREVARLRSAVRVAAGEDPAAMDLSLLLRQAGVRQAAIRQLADVYQPAALVGEIAQLVQPAVSLLALELRFPGGENPAAGGASATGRPATAARRADRQRLDADGGAGAGNQAAPQDLEVVLDGVIAGRRERVDAELAAFVLRLRQSAFFRAPLVVERRLEAVDRTYLEFGPEDADHLLHFTIRAVCNSWRENRASNAVQNVAATLSKAAP